MAYEIRLTDHAREDFLALDARWRSGVKAAMEAHLRHRPAKESKSRIKRLRGVQKADYRLRVGDYRVFYSVDAARCRVDVLRVLHKRQTAEFYEEE